MAEATPADADEQGKSPAVAEGKSPDGGEQPEAEEPQGRQYSEAYVRSLRNEAAKLRNRIEEVEEEKKAREDAEKTELQKALDRAEQLEKEKSALAVKALQQEVGTEKGLPPKSWKYLTGSTQEEMELHAEELGELLADRAKPIPAGFDGGARRTASEKKAPEEEHNDFLLKAMGRLPRSS